MRLYKNKILQPLVKKNNKGISESSNPAFTHHPSPSSEQPLGVLQILPPCASRAHVISAVRFPHLSQPPALLAGSRPHSATALHASTQDQAPSILHTAARVINSKNKPDQAIPQFKISQWLSVAFRIKVKFFHVLT